MKLEIGYGTTVYGTVETSEKGLVYAGNNPKAVQRLIESITREKTQNDKAFLASLPRKLSGHVWAREVKGSK